jgi:excinuclease ABC subunit B
MYADAVTAAMKQAIGETNRRRALQCEYNKEHGITPATVVRAVMNMNPDSGIIDYLNIPKLRRAEDAAGDMNVDLAEQLQAIRLEMFAAAENLEFEKAARLRDQLKRLEGLASPGESGAPPAYEPYGLKRKKSGSMKRPSTRPGAKPTASRASKRPRKFKG